MNPRSYCYKNKINIMYAKTRYRINREREKQELFLGQVAIIVSLLVVIASQI